MVLKVNNLSLPLIYTPMGPVLSTEDELLEPIAWIVNPAVTGEEPQIADHLARGEDVSLLMRHAVRPTPIDDDFDDARARWCQLTGSDPGEDVYILGTGFTYHRIVIPRQTLQDILQALLRRRAELPEPPPAPWLFRRSPYDLAPDMGEEELICELEERAARFKKPLEQEMTALRGMVRDLSVAGLFSEAYFKEKQMWLEMWSCPTLLTYHKAALSFLNHFRTQTSQMMPPITPGAPPVPVLNASICVGKPQGQYRWALMADETRIAVTSDALARSQKDVGSLSFHPSTLRQAVPALRQAVPALRQAQEPLVEGQEPLVEGLGTASGHRLKNRRVAFLGELEQRAHAFKRMLSQEERDDMNSTRSALVRDLEAAGVFSNAYRKHKEHCLRKYPTLLTYHNAALDFLKHFQSQHSPHPPTSARCQPLLSVSISIDELEFPYVAAYSSFDGSR